KVAVAQFGGIALEFIEPLEGETVYSAFLREKGEGFHHICVSFPTMEQLECAKQALIRMGGRVTQSGRTPRVSYWYVEGRGIVLELIIRRQHQGT
ncbi:MAG: VOC family protein, partial [Bacillota bacterium]